MKEYNLEFKLGNCALYTYKTDYSETCFTFDSDLKIVDIVQYRFILNPGVSSLPENEDDYDIRHSCKYGHWQVQPTCLSEYDIEFIHDACKRLF